MSKVDKQTIKNLAKLCRIQCNEEETESLLHDLKGILDYVEQLQELDVDGVEPCNHVLAYIVNVTRSDVIGPTMPRETFLNNSPSHVAGMIRVPTVIKH
jgi:aspartyl-tRNA(Asn)/glutamyl-tRNA(Gln) amidotransferase subunit C